MIITCTKAPSGVRIRTLGPLLHLPKQLTPMTGIDFVCVQKRYSLLIQMLLSVEAAVVIDYLRG